MKPFFLFLLLLAFTSLPVAAQTLPTPVPTGSIFTAQCSSVYYAKLTNVIDGDETWLDIRTLATMQYTPGIWYGYDSPNRWGGSFPEVLDGWLLELFSPCGILPGNVWRNLDGSLLIILVTELRLTDFYAQPCQLGDGSLYCGYHQNVHGYVTADEWLRVSGQ